MGTLPASASGGGWALQPTASPTQGILFAVSCVSATVCTAVGDRGNPSGALAERWNGGRWTFQPTRPLRLGGEFYGVSCSSATACTAVGFYGVGAPQAYPEPLAERWNGKRWAIQPTPPLPHGDIGHLEAVSCASATACTAVGGYGTIGSDLGALTEDWNGKRWAIRPAPAHSGAFLNAVSCTSANACTAVGSHAGYSGLAERWNGKRWAIEHLVPTAASGMGSVSCASATACIAIGGDGNQVIVAESWNAMRWTLQPMPKPTGAYGDGLGSVSCVSATACTAVGGEFTAAGNFGSLGIDVVKCHPIPSACCSCGR